MDMTYGRAITFTTMLVALVGCTTYTGHKLPPSGQLPEHKVSGIPFVMTKPVFSVDIAPDANDPTKPVYTLRSSDVPDSTQRYTIALDPALLVDGTYELTFGDQGNLSSATSTSTSRVVATLESVISYTIDKAASGVAKDMSTVQGRYRSVLINSGEPACIKVGNKKAVKKEIADILDKFVADAKLAMKGAGKDIDAKAKALAISQYHYFNLDQRECLIAVAPASANEMDEDISIVQENYDTGLSKSIAAAKDPHSQKWLKSLQGAVESSDVEAIAKLKEANVPGTVKGISDPATTLVNTKLEAKRLAQTGELFAFMPPDVWRSRHLQYLEAQLNQKRMEKLITAKGRPTAKQLENSISQLEAEWAATLGEPKLIQRIAELDTFLAKVRVVPASSGSPARYAATELVQLREERDKLQERVDSLRSNIIAKNKVIDANPEKTKVEPRTDVSVKLVKPTFIEAVANNPGTVEDLPDFVIVLENNPEPAVRPDPIIPPHLPHLTRRETTDEPSLKTFSGSTCRSDQFIWVLNEDAGQFITTEPCRRFGGRRPSISCSGTLLNQVISVQRVYLRPG
ncbi:hypothetical protein [Pseudomonas frederiksbergensis]|uniref:Lipoprotein n=1 Tax=Pseudomonas frederiksbergensis TaxID=104087 RepID=A0AB33EJT3_9PSED|nr:hypothetical protein [Pseudomonas frederiksbergensis]ATE80472.1 hypothetical protein CNN82_30230 [Pseudomonas frederiksbergensis]